MINHVLGSLGSLGKGIENFVEPTESKKQTLPPKTRQDLMRQSNDKRIHINKKTTEKSEIIDQLRKDQLFRSSNEDNIDTQSITGTTGSGSISEFNRSDDTFSDDFVAPKIDAEHASQPEDNWSCADLINSIMKLIKLATECATALKDCNCYNPNVLKDEFTYKEHNPREKVWFEP